MLVKALLIALCCGLLSLDNGGSQMFRRPLPISLIIGLILGDVPQAILIGGTLELAWLGLANVGGSSPAEMIMGSTIGVSMGILSGGGVAAGVAFAIPVSLLAVQLQNFLCTVNVAFAHMADKAADEGDFKKITWIHIVPGLILAGIYMLLAFLAVFFGSGVVEQIISVVPAALINALTVASYALPAIGIAILMTVMVKKGVLWVFVLLGFTLVAYLKLPMLAIALISIPFAVLYDLILEKGKAPAPQADTKPAISDDGEVDL